MAAPTRRMIVASGALALAPSIAPWPAVAREPPVKKLRILILGGTGFIGPPQVRYALSRGHQVTLFNRGKQHVAWPGQVEELLGDRNTGDLSALAGREWDVCIDNPTTLPFWVRDAGRALAAKVGQYIFVSTISVYATNDKPADETARVAAYQGPDPMAETMQTFGANVGGLYGPLKAVSEQEAERQFPGRATIVRPGLIVGPGDETDRFTYWPARLSRGGEVLAPGDGTDPAQIIDARDLSEWIIRLAEQRTFGVFNAIGPAKTRTMREMLEGVKAAVRSDAHLDWAPVPFLRSHGVSAWADMPAWVPGTGDTAGFMRRSNQRALAAGLTFRPLETTAAGTLAWFKTLSPDRQAKLRAGVAADREATLLAALKASPASA